MPSGFWLMYVLYGWHSLECPCSQQISQILAFAYLGVRISTLGGLTEDSNALSPAEKDALANVGLPKTLLLNHDYSLCT